MSAPAEQTKIHDGIIEEPAALFIVECQWENIDGRANSAWLKVGFAWYREEDAIKDRNHRIKNRPGCKFRVRTVSPPTLRAGAREERDHGI